MTTFHLKEGRRWSSRRQLSQRTGPAPGANSAITSDWIISVALCVGTSVLMPAWLAHWVLAALLNLAGYVWLAVAITRAGPPFGRDHLTAWDAALFSFAMSFSVQAAAHLGVFNT